MKQKLKAKRNEVSEFLQGHIKETVEKGNLSRYTGTFIRLNKDLNSPHWEPNEFEAEVAIGLLDQIKKNIENGLLEPASLAASTYRSLTYCGDLLISENVTALA